MLSASDRKRLAKVRATGLFARLDDARLAALESDDEMQWSGDDALVGVVEHFLYGRDHGEIRLHAPQRAQHLHEAHGEQAKTALVDDADIRYLRLLLGEDAALYHPETHDEYAALFNAALAAIGEKRAFVPIAVTDFEEPLFVLCTEAQRRALADADLLAYDAGDMEMPRWIDESTRADEIATSLERFGLSARADGEEVVLTIDLAGAIALVEKLRASRVHHARVGAWVNEGGLEHVP